MKVSTMQKPGISLIISVYKNSQWLEFIFEALKRQTFKDFEVIVSDDGSDIESIAVTQRLINEAPFPAKHVWHEDKGWRKNTILNKSVVASSSDYLVFIDGDCIPHHKFLAEHYKHRHEGEIVTGRRVQLTKQLCDKLTLEKIRQGFLDHAFLIGLQLIGKETHVENALRVTNNALRKLLVKERRDGILGCNFSLFKSDLMRINGFDERFILPGVGEDSDIELRLAMIGILPRSQKNLITVYHKKHKMNGLTDPDNFTLYYENKINEIAITPYGIKKQEQ